MAFLNDDERRRLHEGLKDDQQLQQQGFYEPQGMSSSDLRQRAQQEDLGFLTGVALTPVKFVYDIGKFATDVYDFALDNEEATLDDYWDFEESITGKKRGLGSKITSEILTLIGGTVTVVGLAGKANLAMKGTKTLLNMKKLKGFKQVSMIGNNGLVQAGLASGTADAIWTSTGQSRLSNMLEGVPGFDNAVTDYLSHNQDDSIAEQRFKNFLEGAILGVGAEVAINSVVGLYRWNKARHIQAVDSGMTNADEALDTIQGLPKGTTAQAKPTLASLSDTTFETITSTRQQVAKQAKKLLSQGSVKLDIPATLQEFDEVVTPFLKSSKVRNGVDIDRYAQRLKDNISRGSFDSNLVILNQIKKLSQETADYLDQLPAKAKKGTTRSKDLIKENINDKWKQLAEDSDVTLAGFDEMGAMTAKSLKRAKDKEKVLENLVENSDEYNSILKSEEKYVAETIKQTRAFQKYKVIQQGTDNEVFGQIDEILEEGVEAIVNAVKTGQMPKQILSVPEMLSKAILKNYDVSKIRMSHKEIIEKANKRIVDALTKSELKQLANDGVINTQNALVQTMIQKNLATASGQKLADVVSSFGRKKLSKLSKGQKDTLMRALTEHAGDLFTDVKMGENVGRLLNIRKLKGQPDEIVNFITKVNPRTGKEYSPKEVDTILEVYKKNPKATMQALKGDSDGVVGAIVGDDNMKKAIKAIRDKIRKAREKSGPQDLGQKTLGKSVLNKETSQEELSALFETLVDSKKGESFLVNLYNARGDHGRMQAVIRNVMGEKNVSLWDIFSEVRKAGLLTGPSTHVQNTIGGIGMQLTESFYRGITALRTGDVTQALKGDFKSAINMPMMKEAQAHLAGSFKVFREPLHKLLAGGKVDGWSKTINEIYDDLSVIAQSSTSGTEFRSYMPGGVANSENLIQALKDPNSTFFTFFENAFGSGATDKFISAGQTLGADKAFDLFGKVNYALSFGAMGVEDTAIKAFSAGGEMAALATRHAHLAGLGDEGVKLIENLVQLKLQNPTKVFTNEFNERLATDIVAQMRKAGLKNTFQEDLEGMFKQVEKLLGSDHPLAKFTNTMIIPFYKTPVNIAMTALRTVPILQLGSRRIQQALSGELGEQAMQIMKTKVYANTFAYATLTGAVMEGKLTGRHPRHERANLLQQGIPEYSIKVGDTWYEYSRFEPLGSMMGLTADVVTLGKKDNASALILAGTNNVINKTFMRGLKDVTDLLFDPESKGSKAFMNMLRPSITPLSGLQKGIIKLTNQTQKDIPKTINDFSEFLEIATQDYALGYAQRKVKVDLLGDTIPVNNPFLRMLGLNTSKTRGTDGEVELLRLGVMNAGQRTASVMGVELTREEFHRLKEMRKEIKLEEVITKIVKTKSYRDLTDPARKMVLADVVREFKEALKGKMIGESKFLLARIQAQAKANAEALSGTGRSRQKMNMSGLVGREFDEVTDLIIGKANPRNVEYDILPDDPMFDDILNNYEYDTGQDDDLSDLLI